jgi:hypothetical protein
MKKASKIFAAMLVFTAFMFNGYAAMGKTSGNLVLYSNHEIVSPGTGSADLLPDPPEDIRPLPPLPPPH